MSGLNGTYVGGNAIVDCGKLTILDGCAFGIPYFISIDTSLGSPVYIYTNAQTGLVETAPIAGLQIGSCSTNNLLPLVESEQNHIFLKPGVNISKSDLINASTSGFTKIHSVQISAGSIDSFSELTRNSNNTNLSNISGTVMPISIKYLDSNINPNDVGVLSSEWDGIKYSNGTLEECSDFTLKTNNGTTSISWVAFK